MKKLLIPIVCMIILLGIGLVSADYTLGNYSLQGSYSGGELIKGYLNISFNNQNNADFTNSFTNNIDLLTLLKNSGVNYNCIPYDCKDGYGSPSTTDKSFYLTGEKLFSFATGNYNQTTVTNLKFKVSSDFGASCKGQFYIDLFDDGNIDFYNNRYVDDPCSAKNYGCFDSSLNSEQYNLVYVAASPKLCEKIPLSEGPAYRLGAKVKNGTSNVRMIMTLYDMSISNSTERGHCQLPLNTEPIQERDCIVNYSSYKGFDALACISADSSSGTTDFQVKAESNSSLSRCGTSFDNIGKNFLVDYEIYAFPLKYASVNNIDFDSTVFSKLNAGASFTTTLSDYIRLRYGSPADCSDKCIVPFRVWGLAQNMNVSDIILSYSSPLLGGTTSDSNLYSISSTKFKISTGALQLDLKNFAINVPAFNGRKVFELKFANNTLISKSINISGGFSFDINPKLVPVGRNVEFSVDISNITSTSWEFGDSTQKVSSTTGRTMHKYSTSGEYEVSVKADRSNGESSTRTFKVFVGDAKSSATLTLDDYKKRLVNLTNQAESYPAWIKVEIKKNIDFDDINESLNLISAQLGNASSDSDYEKVLTNLSNLNIPYGIYSSNIGKNLPMILGFNNIDLKYIEEISQSEVADESISKLKADMVRWIGENYEANISYETVSMGRVSNAEDILTKFKIKILPKIESDETNYLIIGIPENSITFFESYSVKSLDEGSGFYIDFVGGKEIEFYVKGEADSIDIGAYITPEISRLGIYEYIEEQDKPEFRTGLFITGLLIILVLFFIVYILLQEWYKKNYENSLFKNKNDLFNLINFIYNSRVAGLKDRDIRRKLEISGWRGEQLTYAFNKIDGKRTGLWEIPLFSSFEKGKVKKEIEKMHPEGVDTRFINQSNF